MQFVMFYTFLDAVILPIAVIVCQLLYNSLLNTVLYVNILVLLLTGNTSFDGISNDQGYIKEQPETLTKE